MVWSRRVRATSERQHGDDRRGDQQGDDQGPRTESIGASRHGAHPSRCTVAGENAGTQTATYSAPPGAGLAYRTHSPGWATTA